MALWVADLVADGMSNKEIAEEMEIGSRTVKAYVSRLLNFYGVRSRLGLALIFDSKRADTERDESVKPSARGKNESADRGPHGQYGKLHQAGL